jgi:hypothetical protein
MPINVTVPKGILVETVKLWIFVLTILVLIRLIVPTPDQIIYALAQMHLQGRIVMSKTFASERLAAIMGSVVQHKMGTIVVVMLDSLVPNAKTRITAFSNHAVVMALVKEMIQIIHVFVDWDMKDKIVNFLTTVNSTHVKMGYV